MQRFLQSCGFYNVNFHEYRQDFLLVPVILCIYCLYYVSMVHFMYLLSVLCIYGSFYASVVCTIDAGL